MQQRPKGRHPPLDRAAVLPPVLTCRPSLSPHCGGPPAPAPPRAPALASSVSWRGVAVQVYGPEDQRVSQGGGGRVVRAWVVLGGAGQAKRCNGWMGWKWGGLLQLCDDAIMGMWWMGRAAARGFCAACRLPAAQAARGRSPSAAASAVSLWLHAIGVWGLPSTPPHPPPRPP